METLLLTTLATLGYPVYLQGNAPETYPANFITYLTISSPDAAHYDNASIGTSWRYQITFYTSDPSILVQKRDAIRTALKAAGFVPQGKGRNLPSDDPSFIGWTTDFLILEMEVTNS